MVERTQSAYKVAGSNQEDKPISDLDLDWELQRWLGEETHAMEPTSTSAGARVSKADRPSAYSSTRSTAPASGDVSPATSAVSPPPSQAAATTSPLPQNVHSEAMASAMMESLSTELDVLYQRATKELSTRSELFEKVTGLLQGARQALLNGPAGVTEAEKLVREAQSLLKRHEDSRQWSSSYGTLILGYEFLFFLAFVAVLAFDRPLALWAGTWTGVTSALSMRDILPFWDTMIWGGIGGVLGALYSLYWHVTELQDFDRQYNMWYVVQPIMGGMLGAFIYLIVVSGMLAMHSTVPTTSTWFPSALACLCGFRQKFILELLDKLMEVIGLRPILSKAMKATKETNE